MATSGQIAAEAINHTKEVRATVAVTNHLVVLPTEIPAVVEQEAVALAARKGRQDRNRPQLGIGVLSTTRISYRKIEQINCA